MAKWLESRACNLKFAGLSLGPAGIEFNTTTEVPLSKAPNPQLLPPVYLDGLNAEIILIILCIIVYVTNKAHLSLICIVLTSRITE